MDIINRILELKDSRGWTVNNLAMEAGLTQSTLSTMLKRNTPPKIETLESICRAFNITLAQFFCIDDNIDVVTQTEKELLTLFRKQNTAKQKAIIELLK